MKHALLLLILVPCLSLAHGDAVRDIGNKAGQLVEKLQDIAPNKSNKQRREPTAWETLQQVEAEDFSYAHFPTLHPLLVHIPVVLIPLSLFIYILGSITHRHNLHWLAAFLVSIGFLGGCAAAFPYHPHTEGLKAAAQQTLYKHDLFAYLTLAVALAASVVSILSCLPLLRLRLVKSLAIVLLLLASGSVAITGHYGGQLAYVHGVGPEGRYLRGTKSHSPPPTTSPTAATPNR